MERVSPPYGYTGEQQSGDLVYLRARYVNVSDGRFLSRDTWGGNYNSPQTLNRWNYSQANPINNIDPTGTCSFSPSENVDYVEGIMKLPKWDWLNTYTAAGIAVQCWATKYDLKAKIFDPEYGGLGPGKITNKQKETPYGERIPDPDYPKNKTKNRGYGLLCYTVDKIIPDALDKDLSCTICKTAKEMDEIYGQGNYKQEDLHDQTQEKWAVEYMRRRIKLVTDACVAAGCSSTDIYIVAALAQNGPGFTIFNLDDWLTVKKNRINKDGLTLDWDTYFKNPGNWVDTSQQLQRFEEATDSLKTWYYPRDINFNTVHKLSEIGN